MNHYYLVQYWYLANADDNDCYFLRCETKEDAVRMKKLFLSSSDIDPSSISIEECFDNGSNIKTICLDDD